jgi:hypothetical protein
MAIVYQEKPGDPLYCENCPPDKRNAWFESEQRRRAQDFEEVRRG